MNSNLAHQFLAFKMAAYKNPSMAGGGWQDFTNTLRNLSYHYQKQTAALDPAAKVVFLSPSQRAEIIDRYKQSNRRVAAEYLTISQESLFVEPPSFPNATELSLATEDVAQISSALFVEAQTRARVAERNAKQVDREAKQLRATLIAAGGQIDELHTNLERWSRQLTKTTRQLKSGSVNAQSQIKELRADFERNSKQLNRILRATRHLSSGLAGAKLQIDKLQANFKRRSKQVDRDNRHLSAEVASTKSQFDELRANFDTYTLNIERLSDGARNLRRRLRRESDDIRHDLRSVEQSLEKDIKEAIEEGRTTDGRLLQVIVALWLRSRRNPLLRMKRWFRSETSIIRRSKKFDEVYYLDRNPQVKKVGEDPIEHYVRFGTAQLLNPSPSFNTQQYFRLNPAIALTGCNPLVDSILKEQEPG